MVKKAFLIAHSKQASLQYLSSQIYEGFTSQWEKELFLSFQGPIEKVYTSLDNLSKDVVHFNQLHIQTQDVTI